MREIKFRAWDVHGNRLTGEPCMQAWDDIKQMIMPWDSSNLTFMQYTGRKDKYGVGIYEGDVIEKDINGNKYRWVMQYDDKFMAFLPKSDNIKGLENDGGDAEEIKEPKILPVVIGNIYENPELLESKS